MDIQKYVVRVRDCIEIAKDITEEYFGKPTLLEQLGFKPSTWANRHDAFREILRNLLKDVTLTE